MFTFVLQGSVYQIFYPAVYLCIIRICLPDILPSYLPLYSKDLFTRHITQCLPMYSKDLFTRHITQLFIFGQQWSVYQTYYPVFTFVQQGSVYQTFYPVFTYVQQGSVYQTYYPTVYLWIARICLPDILPSWDCTFSLKPLPISQFRTSLRQTNL